MHGISVDTLLYGLGIAASVVCGATGVLEAGRKHIDLFGAITAGIAASLGGGTVRDLLLDRKVFWIADQTYLIATIAAAVMTFFLARRWRLPAKLFLLPDAMGLALFTVVGTQIGLQFQTPWLVASLMGVITGVFGGLLRDVLANEMPLVFTSELYATAAWLGAVAMIVMQELGLGYVASSFLGMGVVILIRLAAIRWHITLPSLKTGNS
ncbi:membrane protein [Betaproteobacteria bacterium]|nr:membrane protein [Betaproteobacteria bacterium]GHU11871.1 membrane protein [Betaproteobacteria bacterium]GHU44242.1 membrane protein [Betaproteobacteria bacterium]